MEKWAWFGVKRASAQKERREYGVPQVERRVNHVRRQGHEFKNPQFGPRPLNPHSDISFYPVSVG